MESRNSGEVWLYHPKYLGIKVSSKGRVVDYYTGYEYKHKKTVQGYYVVQFRVQGKPNVRISKGVHRIVAEVFFPIKDQFLYEANHISGNKADNSAHNVNWLTRQENLQHARDTGLFKRQFGEANGRFKYSQELIDKMKSDLDNGESYRAVSDKYGLTLSSLYHVVNRRGKK